MKKLLLISLVLAVPMIARADHEACIAIFPPPPGCLHDEGGDDNNNDKVFIGAALLLGGYYLFTKNDDVESRYNLISGLNLFRKGRFEVNSFALPTYELQSPEDFPVDDMRFNLLSFNFRFER